jgi:hypothetical protein
MVTTATRHARMPGHGAGRNGRVTPGSIEGTPDPVAPPALPTDPVGAAKAAGLRYVTDQGPGIRRKRAGRGWSYVGDDGQRITDPAVLKRIKALGIPPPTPASGFARTRAATYRPPGATPRVASSTATTRAGARFATRPSTAG